MLFMLCEKKERESKQMRIRKPNMVSFQFPAHKFKGNARELQQDKGNAGLWRNIYGMALQVT